MTKKDTHSILGYSPLVYKLNSSLKERKKGYIEKGCQLVTARAVSATRARKFEAYRQTIGHYFLIDYATFERIVKPFCNGDTAYKTHVYTVQVF